MEIHEAIRVEGEHELSRPVQALAISGLAAGLCLGFSFLAQASLQHALPEAKWAPLITKFGYSVGFFPQGRRFPESISSDLLADFQEISRDIPFFFYHTQRHTILVMQAGKAQCGRLHRSLSAMHPTLCTERTPHEHVTMVTCWNARYRIARVCMVQMV